MIMHVYYLLVHLFCQVQEWFEVDIKEIVEYIDNNFPIWFVNIDLLFFKERNIWTSYF
jgi:hypothetical protein